MDIINTDKVENSETYFENIKTVTEFYQAMNIVKQQLYSDKNLLAVKIGENTYAVRNGYDSVGVLKV